MKKSRYRRISLALLADVKAVRNRAGAKSGGCDNAGTDHELGSEMQEGRDSVLDAEPTRQFSLGSKRMALWSGSKGTTQKPVPAGGRISEVLRLPRKQILPVAQGAMLFVGQASA